MPFDLRGWLWRCIPASVIVKLRWARKIYRRHHYYADKVFARDTGLTRSDLESAFRQAGLKEDDLVLVHSAMSGLGLIQGGAETVIRALLDVITPSGTLAMPTFTVSGSMLEYAQSGEMFDVRKTPAKTGKLTEIFRCHPNVLRSLHPTHSVASLGARAAWLTEDHHRCTTPFGSGSPFAKLIEAHGKILCVGVEISYITSYHAFEDQMPHFPEQVYLPGAFTLPVRDAEGNQTHVVTRIHDPQLSPRRIEKRPEVLKQIKDYLVKTGRLKSVQTGKGFIHLVGAQELNVAMGEMLERGITIYRRRQEN